MFGSYPTPPLKKCLEHPTVPVHSNILEIIIGGKGGREGVRGRARRYRTGVEEGGSEGQGQPYRTG